MVLKSSFLVAAGILFFTVNVIECSNFTYEQLIKMRQGLEVKLMTKARQLKGRSSHHAPPGGSTVEMDDLLTSGMVYINTDVQVIVSVSRIDIMDVDSQTLKFAAEVALGWVDTNLVWNYSKTDLPIYNMVVDHDAFWTPELLPQDIIGYDYIPSSIKPTLTVFYHGTCISKVTATITVPCDVEVLTYPFDTHHCHLNFIQAFNPGQRVNFIPVPASDNSGGGGDMFFNTEHRHREWDLVSLNSSSADEGEIYHLEIVLKRKATFYAIVLILPCIILNLITFLMFVVGVDGTDRIDLALNLILSYFVLLLILIDAIPPSGGEIPLLGLYVVTSTVIVVFIMVGSLVLIKLHRMNEAGKRVHVCAFLAHKFKILKCLEDNENGANEEKKKKSSTEKIALENNNPSETAPLAAEEGSGSGGDDQAKEMDALIFNLNFIMFIVTAIMHFVLLLSVCIIWMVKAE